MKRLASALLASVVALSVARAHEIHTTHTTVTADAQGYTLMVRAFADDLSASVARFHRRTPPADSSLRVPEVVAYVSARMGMTAHDGASVLQSCGVKRVHDAYMLCLRVATASLTKPLTLSNQMLAELHADQVNIVQCAIGGTRRTTLFTNGRMPAVIAEKGRCR